MGPSDTSPSLETARHRAVELLNAAEPYSPAQYFALLLHRAVGAAERGDYGIAAAAVMRAHGVEVVSIGVNSMMTAHDPLGHAETKALAQLGCLDRGDQQFELHPWRSSADVSELDAAVLVRAAPNDDSDFSVYATLEPCPMCTVALINAGVHNVVIAIEDPIAGVLMPTRLSALAPLWPLIAKRHQMQIQSSSNPDPDGTEPAVPRELLRLLEGVFAANRPALDDRLETRGVLDLGRVIQSVSRILGDRA